MTEEATNDQSEDHLTSLVSCLSIHSELRFQATYKSSSTSHLGSDTSTGFPSEGSCTCLMQWGHSFMFLTWLLCSGSGLLLPMILVFLLKENGTGTNFRALKHQDYQDQQFSKSISLPDSVSCLHRTTPGSTQLNLYSTTTVVVVVTSESPITCLPMWTFAIRNH